MIGLLSFFLAVVGLPFKSKLRFEAENAVLPSSSSGSGIQLGQTKRHCCRRWFVHNLIQLQYCSQPTFKS